jgi:cytochrome b6-f complex iron-sulfur subunit
MQTRRQFCVHACQAASVAAVGSILNGCGDSNPAVAHTGQDSFTALTAICTHEQCTVTGFDNQRYVCPCHGSQYDTSGWVVNGPAPTALRVFPTQFSNSVLTFTV